MSKRAASRSDMKITHGGIGVPSSRLVTSFTLLSYVEESAVVIRRVVASCATSSSNQRSGPLIVPPQEFGHGYCPLDLRPTRDTCCQSAAHDPCLHSWRYPRNQAPFQYRPAGCSPDSACRMPSAALALTPTPVEGLTPRHLNLPRIVTADPHCSCVRAPGSCRRAHSTCGCPQPSGCTPSLAGWFANQVHRRRPTDQT